MGDRIQIGDIGFDIQQRGSVGGIDSPDPYNAPIYPHKLDNRQANGVRSMRRTSGKDPPWRSVGRRGRGEEIPSGLVHPVKENKVRAALQIV